MTRYYAGIEGGATHSSAILLNESGETIGVLENQPPTNHWHLGMEECCNQIIEIIQKILVGAGLPKEQPLAGLGLCLSGCEERKSNDELKMLIKSKYPSVGDVEVESDTMGPILATSSSGGIVLIAGTGSNLLLTKPDKSVARCGGLGYLLGDQGSAWWIAHKSIKYCVKDQDNYKEAPFKIDYVWEAIRDHFGIEHNREMLKHCYLSFNKPFYAKLTVKLAEGADKGDELCKHLFHRAGVTLAMHVLAIRDEIPPDLFKGPTGLLIVCVGSVWNSWKYIQEGFTSTLGITTEGGTPQLTRFSLIRLTVSPALGAALQAAPDIPRNYSQNYSVLYSFGL